MKKRENSSLPSFKELSVGSEFPPIDYELSESVITKYLQAVEEEEFPVSGVVPPLAIAACAMTALSQSFTVPPGSIQAQMIQIPISLALAIAQAPISMKSTPI